MENVSSPGAPPTPPPTWQDRARQRALAGARHRTDDQLFRLLRAAQGMVNEDVDLTVPALVARAGMSTKTFYRHFASRDELLLAVLEEELSIAAHFIRKAIDAHEGPVERLRACVLAYVRLPDRYSSPSVRRAWTQQSQRLVALYPERTTQSRGLIVAAFRDVIDDLVAGGYVELDDPGLTARGIFHLISRHLVDAAYQDDSDLLERIAAQAWRFCCTGLGLPDPSD